MAYQLPSSDGRIAQPNDGDSIGNVFASWGVDFDTNRGSVTGSDPLKNVIDETDDADLNGYVAKYVEYSNKLFAVSNVVFKSDSGIDDDITDPASWSQDTASGTPTVSNVVTDAVEFDSLLLVVDGNDIVAFNNTSWSSWWQGTLGQSALSTGQRFFLKVGPDGNLYIVDNGNKIYRVTPAGVVTKTGQGTLDFSDRGWECTAMEMTSTRMFAAFYSRTGKEGAHIIEWDLGPQSISPNRIHKVGAERVQCIPIWEDVPYAVLSDGRIKYFNGERFVTYEGVRFPKFNNRSDSDWLHNNGWAIVDDKPHFLANPRTETPAQNQLQERVDNGANLHAGVWCLDPKVGLYNRYPLTNGTTDRGQTVVGEVGALFGLEHFKTKFLCSYSYINSSNTAPIDDTPGIFAHDSDISIARNGFLITPFVLSSKGSQLLEVYHNQLNSGESYDVYYRRYRQDEINLFGVWANSTTFHSTDDGTNVSTGDLLLISFGPGSGHYSRVANVERSSTVTVITLADENPNWSSGISGGVRVLNFKFMAKFDNTVSDWHEAAAPHLGTSRKIQMFIGFKQNAASNIRLDNVIIN